jgi:anti-sigma-K factor RskA
MVHEDYKELISAHALAALDEPDERVLNEHLAGCSECRLELETWQATAVALAFTAEPLEPSPQLRDRVLSQARVEAREPRAQAADHGTPETGAARVLPFTAAPRNVWSSIGSLGAIAAAILFVALLGSIIVLWQQNRRAEEKLRNVTAELQTLRTQLATQQQFAQLMTKRDSRMALLSGTKEAPDAKAMIAYDSTGHAMLMAHGLPAAPADKVYQLWFIVGNKPMPGKVFTTDRSGTGSLNDEVPSVARNAAVFAVTLEPKPGDSPTGPIVLSSSL